MSQLAGRTCVICDERIVAATKAKFCESCGNSVHRQCANKYQAAGDQGGCAKCGGTAETAAAPIRTRPAMHLEHWLYIVTALVLVGVVFLMWPTGGDEGDTEDALAERSDEEKPAVLPIVEIETNYGVIRAELFSQRAPKTVENFVDLVNKKFYDGIIFHRVIRGFMSQTGDPMGTGFGGRVDKGLPGKFLLDEFHPELRHDRAGLLSMANSGPNSGDCQFFITSGPSPGLDNKHAIFGRVTEGMNVARKINEVATTPDDRPVTEVTMIKVRMKK